MSQYSGYGNPYYNGYYYPYDNQTPFYGYANLTMLLDMQKVLVQVFITLMNFSPLIDTQEYIMSTKILIISTNQETHHKAHTCKNMEEAMMITENFLQSQDFGQSPHSGRGKERQQTPLQDFEEIETDEDKILNPEVPRNHKGGLLKQHPLKDFDIIAERTYRLRRTGCKHEVSGQFITRQINGVVGRQAPLIKLLTGKGEEPEIYSESNEERTAECLDMTVLIDGKLEDPLKKDKKVVPDEDQFQRVVLLGGVICGQKISMGSVSEGSSCGGGSTN
ncbi:hypothetical protein PPACK8108_LOCUS17514 [Phakopsora pachyrhizi]|uniref:Uncharacterized protein n=1 Tax=Phakopsora pachyrhizi TaxID=170000 RepID=A0AAV0BDH9_PHAPC|nr:hypothetical protein PPACK8108_LOCUS17514 [Phakopsora pachyrhizi]